MADFIREIGNNTRLMIREGPGPSQFQFFVQTGTSAANTEHPWSWGLRQDGGPWYNSPRLTFLLKRTGDWQLMGRIEDFGELRGSIVDLRLTIHDAPRAFPTYDFHQTVDKRTRPGIPPAPEIHERTENSIHVKLVEWDLDNPGHDLGGLPVLESEIWGSHDGTPRLLKPNTKDAWFTGLSPRTQYYFWGKMRNARGWSDLGYRSEAGTLGLPDAPNPPNVRAIGPFSVEGEYTVGGPSDGGSPIVETEIGYGINPLTPETSVKTRVILMHDLIPAQAYYFWARDRNAIGWSGWSNRTQVLLPAGILVNDEGVMKRALPWVKHNGVWKIARPWTKAGGTWRETQP